MPQKRRKKLKLNIEMNSLEGELKVEVREEIGKEKANGKKEWE